MTCEWCACALRNVQSVTSDKITTGGKINTEAHIALDDGNLSWAHAHAPEFCGNVQGAVLRDEQQVAVGVIECPARHAAISQVLVNSDA